MFKWVLFVLILLYAAARVRADEFEDRVARFAAETARRRAAPQPPGQTVAACRCGCDAGIKCACDNCDHHTADRINPGARGADRCQCGCVLGGGCTCDNCNLVSKGKTRPCACGGSCEDCPCSAAYECLGLYQWYGRALFRDGKQIGYGYDDKYWRLRRGDGYDVWIPAAPPVPIPQDASATVAPCRT